MTSKLWKLLAILILIVGVSFSLPQALSSSEASGRPAEGSSTPQLLQAALDRGDIDKDTYLLYLSYALGDFHQLPVEYHGNVPWYGTEHMLYLQQEVSTIQDSAKRTQVERMLAGACGSVPGSGQPNTDNTSANFHIQYNAATIGGGSGLTLTSYRTSLDASWNREITTFGWAAPPVSISPPPGNRYHVLVAPLGTSLYGYVSASGAHTGYADGDLNGTADGDNPNTAWTESNPYWAIATCMVLNDDYSGFPGGAQFALDATTGHEFHHSIQFGYGVLTTGTVDGAFVEGSAVWMEDEVNDASNDNYNYLWPQFTKCMGEYPEGAPSFPEYSYWLTFRGLTERYGTTVAGGSEQVMQNYWEYVSNPATNVNGEMLVALDAALGMAPASTNLPDAYHAYAIAAGFMRTCGSGYVYPYCFEEAASYVSYMGSAPAAQGTIGAVGGSYAGSVEDNYALNWIDLPTGDTYDVTLQNTSAGGQLRGSVVCDDGSQLNVTALPSVVGTGGSTTLSGFNAAGCNRVLAVITNQSQTADDPASCTARSYQLSTAAASPSAGKGWVQVNTDGFGNGNTVAIQSLEVFGGQLYADATNFVDGAQIWRTADGTTWTAVSSPGFGSAYTDTNPVVFDMVEFEGQLYAGTGNWISDGVPGQIWRSSNGTSWTLVEDNGFDNANNVGITTLVTSSGSICAATYNPTDGLEIWCSATGDDGDWTSLVTGGNGDADNDIVTGMIDLDYLYVAVQNQTDGAEIWRTNDGITWPRIITGGFGDTDNTETGSFGVIGDRLCVGTRNSTTGGQIHCTTDGTTWTPAMSNGFGDINNVKVESLVAHEDALYAVTGNQATGMEVWRSSDGSTWTQFNADGFGDANNTGTLWSNASTEFQGDLYIGTQNFGTGGEVWRLDVAEVHLPLVLKDD